MIDEEREDPEAPEELEAELQAEEERARRSRRSRREELPAWARFGDGVAELVVLLILLGGFFSRGYISSPILRGWAFLGCAALGGWSAVCAWNGRWGGSRMRASRWFLALMALPLVWGGLQLVPLPMGAVARVSPIWRQTREAISSIGMEPPAKAPVAHSPAKGLESWTQWAACFLFFAGLCVLAARRSCAARLALTVSLVSILEGAIGAFGLFVQGNRTQGAAYNPNHHAALILMGLPIFFAWLLQYKRFSHALREASLFSGTNPLLFFIAFGMLAAVGWLTAFSRGSLIFGGAILLCWIILEVWGEFRELRSSDRLALTRGGVILGLAAAATLLVTLTTLMQSASVLEGIRARGIGDAVQGRQRTELWRATWRALMETPWLGLGFFGTETALNRFSNLPLYDIPIWSHNDYVQIAAEMGVPATLLGLCLLAGALVAAGRDWARQLESANWGQGLVHRAAWAGVAITLGHSMVDFHLRIPLVGFTFLVLLALALNWGLFGISPRIFAQLWDFGLAREAFWRILRAKSRSGSRWRDPREMEEES